MNYIYFVQQAPSGPIKIGFSTRPSVRIGQLRTASSHPLQLLCLVEGTLSEEKELHERFAADRLSGEWFKPTQELTSLISEYIRSRSVECPTQLARADDDEYTGRARVWASSIEDMFARLHKIDVAAARRLLAARLNLAPGFLENLRRGRGCAITAADYEKIRVAYIDTMEAELAELKMQLSNVLGESAAETQLAAARQILAGEG